eukprot:NODE_325_length_10950_cov_0.271864.p6 type:complete len:123 gc:universal NODE_325_length_10950_cov_0.271864:2227-2595(+)
MIYSNNPNPISSSDSSADSSLASSFAAPFLGDEEVAAAWAAANNNNSGFAKISFNLADSSKLISVAKDTFKRSLNAFNNMCGTDATDGTLAPNAKPAMSAIESFIDFIISSSVISKISGVKI